MYEGQSVSDGWHSLANEKTKGLAHMYYSLRRGAVKAAKTEQDDIKDRMSSSCQTLEWSIYRSGKGAGRGDVNIGEEGGSRGSHRKKAPT